MEWSHECRYKPDGVPDHQLGWRSSRRGGEGDPSTDIVLDNISAYASAANLHNIGDITLGKGGVAQGAIDMLIAYQKSGLSGLTIADVTIDATNASKAITDTAVLNGGSLQVHDLVTINVTGLNLGNFDPQNVQFHV